MRTLTTLENPTNAASFALDLVEHPRLASNAGLGGLSSVLRQNASYAAQHGWAATLTRVLDAHPRVRGRTRPDRLPGNADAHDRDADAHNTRCAATGQHGLQAVNHDTRRDANRQHDLQPSTGSTPAALPAIVNDPLSIAIGGTLDVTLPDLGLEGGADLHHHAPAAAGEHDVQPRHRRARVRAGARPGGHVTISRSR